MIRQTARLGPRGIALLIVLGLGSLPAHATKFWRNGVVIGNWNVSTNWSSISASDTTTSGVPALNEAVNIVNADGTARTITYNVAAPNLGVLNIDLTGPGATTSTFSMPANNLTTSGFLLGNFGRGTIDHSAGTLTGNNPSLDSVIGNNAGSNGVYSLSGTGVLSVARDLFVGNAGTGAFNLSGTGSVTANGSEYVGNIGTGNFTQSGGTNTINGAGSLYLGFNAVGGNGSYTLSGGALVASLSEYVGFSGTGTFTQSAGSNTINTSAFGIFGVGYNVNSMGTYNLSGNGAFSAAKQNIGQSGAGTFNHSGGTNTIAGSAGYLDVGVSNGGTGTYNLSGAAVLSADVSEFIGDGGTGVFNQTGGTNTISGVGHALYLGFSPASTGSYTLSAGSLNVTGGSENIGYGASGSFNQSGGTNAVQTLFLGVNSLTATGTYTLSGGALSVNGFEIIGSMGTGIFNHTGGTNSLEQSLTVGSLANSTGTYNLGVAGSLSTPGETIGSAGNGTMTQTGGTNAVAGDIRIGVFSGSTGHYTLSAGLASVSVNTYVGGGFNGAGGTGVLTVSGTGALTVGGMLTVYNTAGTSLNLSGGTINAAALNFDGAPALFNWTGGKLTLNSNVTWDSAAAAMSTSAAFGSARALGSNQTLAVTGNETLGGTGEFALTLNSGSTHNVSGGLAINPAGSITVNPGSTLTYSTFTQAGGVVNGTLQNQTVFTYQNGLFNGRLLNQGTVNFSSSFAAGNGIENDTSMTVAAGQTLTTNGAGLDNHGPFTIASGGALVATSVANQSEFIVNGSATATTFSNTALLHGIGQVTAAVTNAASGDVRGVAGERLRFAGASFTNQGLVEAIGSAASPAEVEFDSPVTNVTTGGLIAGSNSLYRFNSGLTNQASFALSIGTNNVLGDITNSATGKIVVSGGAGVTFYDDIIQNGTFRVSKVGSTTSVAVVFGAFSGSGGSTGGGDIFFEGDLRPGNSPATVSFDNNIGFGASATLDFELGGTTAGSQYDQVHVTGALALGGTLQVELINLGAGLFAPAAGDSFDLLDWGSLSGTFSAIQLPALAGALAWNTSQLYTSGVLSVVSAGLAGDYNNNGVVDAADYVAWRKNNNTAVTLPNDSTAGTDPTDYAVWRAHFGQTAGSGSGAVANAVVPEPATLMLLLFAAAGRCLRRSRAE